MNPIPDIPAIVLHAPDGARAVIALHGAHVLSWQPPGQGEALFLSRQSDYGPSAAIRGGVPVIFPQFSTRGSGQRHGFVRNAAWHCVGAEGDRARFEISSADVPAAGWPHGFRLQYEVLLEDGALVLALHIANTDTQAWHCHAALHTYLRVEDIATTTLEGLQGCDFLEQAGIHVANPLAGRQNEARLGFAGEIDRIYANIPGPLTLRDGRHALEIRQEGFADAVVWNPGVEKARGIRDLDPRGVHHFACVEAGAILQAIELAPGQRWTGRQILRHAG